MFLASTCSSVASHEGGGLHLGAEECGNSRVGATARWWVGGNSGGSTVGGGGSSTSKNRSSHHKYVSKTV